MDAVQEEWPDHTEFRTRIISDLSEAVTHAHCNKDDLDAAAMALNHENLAERFHARERDIPKVQAALLPELFKQFGRKYKDDTKSLGSKW